MAVVSGTGLSSMIGLIEWEMAKKTNHKHHLILKLGQINSKFNPPQADQ